jgi:nucleoside-diphosphate-sugar epimerase
MIAGIPRGGRVFVTGASGFLGAHVVRALKSAGAEVYDTRIDLLDVSTLRAALAVAEPDCVIHLAAYGARPGERDRDRMFAVNVQGSVNLWSALPSSVRRVVMAGTCVEYAAADALVNEQYPCDPRNAYAASKHAAVSLLRAFGREEKRQVVVLRPFGPYGPGDDSDRVVPFTLRRLIAGESVPLSHGEQLRDFAFVDDHARAFLLAATSDIPHAAPMYNIGSGEAVTLRSVIEAAADAVDPSARQLLQFGALPYRADEGRVIGADISAARRDLGYQPAVPIADGLVRTVSWMRSLVRA